MMVVFNSRIRVIDGRETHGGAHASVSVSTTTQNWGLGTHGSTQLDTVYIQQDPWTYTETTELSGRVRLYADCSCTMLMFPQSYGTEKSGGFVQSA